MQILYKRKKSLVKKLREHCNIYQSELAEMLGVPQSIVSFYENFKRAPSQRCAEKLVWIAEKNDFKLTLRMLEKDYQ